MLMSDLEGRKTISYLGAIDADDTICTSVAVIVKWHIDWPVTGCNPILFGLWVYVEDMRFCGEDWLLTSNIKQII